MRKLLALATATTCATLGGCAIIVTPNEGTHVQTMWSKGVESGNGMAARAVSLPFASEPAPLRALR